MADITEVIEKYHSDINSEFPRKTELTDEVFGIITEMMSFEYSDLSSDKKRLRQALEYLRDIIFTALDGLGSEVNKKYIKALLNMFSDKDMSLYISDTLKTEADSFLEKLDYLKYDFIYWNCKPQAKKEELLRLKRFG